MTINRLLNNLSTPDELQDNEKTLLLSLSKGIAMVRDEKELKVVISWHLKKLLPFNDMVIVLVNEDKATHRCYLNYFEKGRSASNDFTKLIVSGKCPVNDGIIDALFYARLPQAWSIAEVAQWNKVPNYIPFWAENGLKRMAGAALRHKEENIGCLFFYSDEEDAFAKPQLHLLQSISTILSIAVANILADEEIEAREKEKDILFSISNDIALIRDKKALLRIIHRHLKSLFNVNDVAVRLLNKEKETHSIYMIVAADARSSHPDYDFIIKHESTIYDGIFDKALQSPTPIINNIDKLSRNDNAPLYVKFLLETGIQETVVVGLRNGNEDIGTFILFAEETSTFRPRQLNLISGIAHQVSLAVANILANEELIKRENEKSFLLDLGNKCAAIKDKKDLVDILFKKLKDLFSITDLHISLLSEDRQYSSIYIITVADKKRNQPGYQTFVTAQTPVTAAICKKALDTQLPVIFDPRQTADKNTDPSQPFLSQNGIEEGICVVLKNGAEVIGFLTLLAEKKNTFRADQFYFIERISYQTSTAVSHLLANDEIRLREEEKENLLSLSNTIATVRDKKDLAHVLDVKLKQLCPFSDILITTIDYFHNRHLPYIYHFTDTRTAHSNFSQLIKMPFSKNDPLINTTMAADTPVLYEIDELAKDPDSPAYIAYIASTGGQQLLGVALRNGSINLGSLFMLSEQIHEYQDKHFSLIKGISSQLSIALANILANDEILQREEDKSVLLSISNNITAVRTKQDLLGMIDQQIKKLFSFEEFAIFLTNEDKRTYSTFLYNQEGLLRRETDLSEIMKESFRLSDNIVDLCLKSPIPIVFDLEELRGRKHLPRYLPLWLEDPIKEIIGISLHVGNQNIGCILICLEKPHTYTENRLGLLQAVGVQISAGIANILANEKIERQLVEISQYKQQLQDENQYLQQEIETVYNYSEIVGESEEMRKAFYLVAQVAETESSVLILGETGTGKELIARAIHNSSSRKDKLMIKVNCATLPANLIESELFGHERGSFTGATDRRIGKFELAHHGTLFLDEIGELPIELQVKLLRALQEKEIERVGGRSTIKVDVRIVAATNRNLYKEVQAGRFRSDLFFRLDVFPITLPPLRDRKEDIPALAAHFIAKHSRLSGRKVTSLSRNALKDLMSYDWPGNVRELEHLMERTILLTNGISINQIHLPVAAVAEPAGEDRSGRIKTIDEIEREHIMMVLKKCKGRVAGPGGAAEVLKIPSTTLNSKIKRLGITKEYMTTGKKS